MAVADGRVTPGENAPYLCRQGRHEGKQGVARLLAAAAHALPHWVIVVQDNALLTCLILAEAYLLGTLMTLGWVRSIEDIPAWGIFHGIGVLLFFAAGATAAGVALRCSVTAAAAFQRRAWGTGLFNFTGLLVFSASEVWASLSERSANLAPTPADNAVLNLLGWHGVPVSPTVVIVALLLPFASLYWGFSQQQHAPAKTVEDIEADRARKLAEQRVKERTGRAESRREAPYGDGVFRPGKRARFP